MSFNDGTSTANSNGTKPAKPAKFGLEFVNVGAISQAEKERNQRLLRSTAMKSFRRRQLSERSTQSESNSKKATEAETRRPKSIKGLKADHQATSLTSYRDSSSESFSEDSWFSGDCNSQEEDSFDSVEPNPRRSLCTQSSRALGVVTSPCSPLGAGRVDPFHIFPVDVPSPVNELIDHCVTHLWPGFRGSNGTPSKQSCAWLEKLYERPIVMHALLFGAAVHMDVLRSPRLSFDSPTRLHHKVHTLRLLKEELKTLEKTCLDAILLVILCLATNEVETVANNMKQRVRSPFNSPLTNVQWLDVYGNITHISAHTMAMRSLVDRRNGLESIKLDGLAEVLSFSDILGATQSLSTPHWPLLERTKISRLEVYKPTTTNLGQGIQDLLSLGIPNRTISVLHEMAELTTIIDDHCRGAHFISDTGILIDHRNTIQHNLLSLPKGDELPAGEVSSIYLYDAIRYAAIIYSAAVTFPLPPLTGIFAKSAAVLKTVLEKSKLDVRRRPYSKVILWILVLGGISASGTPDRAWYVRNLAAVSKALDLSKWNDVAEELEKLLWLESACDAGGRLLWTAVLNERQATERGCLDNMRSSTT